MASTSSSPTVTSGHADLGYSVVDGRLRLNDVSSIQSTSTSSNEANYTPSNSILYSAQSMDVANAVVNAPNNDLAAALASKGYGIEYEDGTSVSEEEPYDPITEQENGAEGNGSKTSMEDSYHIDFHRGRGKDGSIVRAYYEEQERKKRERELEAKDLEDHEVLVCTMGEEVGNAESDDQYDMESTHQDTRPDLEKQTSSKANAVSTSQNLIVKTGSGTKTAQAIPKKKGPSKARKTPPLDEVWEKSTFKGKSNREKMDRFLTLSKKDPNHPKYRKMKGDELIQTIIKLQTDNAKKAAQVKASANLVPPKLTTMVVDNSESNDEIEAVSRKRARSHLDDGDEDDRSPKKSKPSRPANSNPRERKVLKAKSRASSKVPNITPLINPVPVLPPHIQADPSNQEPEDDQEDVEMSDNESSSSSNSDSDLEEGGVDAAYNILAEVVNAQHDSIQMAKDHESRDDDTTIFIPSKYRQYASRSPSIILFDDEGKLLLPIDTQRKVGGILRTKASIRGRLKREANPKKPNNDLRKVLTQFKKELRVVRNQVAKKITDKGLDVTVQATQIINDLLADGIENGRI